MSPFPNPFGKVFASSYGKTFRNLSARSAGRAAKPRVSAISGWSPKLAGSRAAGVPAVAAATTANGQSQFALFDVPVLWNALAAKFGRNVDFWPDGEEAQAFTVTIIWKEGVEDEDTSPGRYSHAHVMHASLGRAPTLRDMVASGDEIFDIVRVDALPYEASTIVLQSRSESH